MHNPNAFELTANHFIDWRAQRLEDENSISTVNNALAYLRALFNELERINEWKTDNPFSKIRRIKSEEPELTYLSDDQIINLLLSCDQSNNPHTRIVAEICLGTGARWSEAEKLKSYQIGDHRITFAKTKNGRNRSLPISDCLYRKLTMFEGPQLFKSCYSAFREAIQRAGIDLPSGQLSHVLRHTFASRFMMNGGNILVLQRALGHASLQMTMRYAHFSPDHLYEVKTLNPLA
jgi:integrase